MRLWVKVALVILPLAALAVAGISVCGHRAIERVLLRQVEERAESMAAGARVPSIVDALAKAPDRRVPAVLGSLASAGAVEALILAPDGRVVASSSEEHAGGRVFDPALAEALGPAGRALRRTGPLVAATVAVRAASGRVLGAVRVVVDAGEALAMGDAIERRLLSILGATAVAFCSVVLVVVLRLLRPLQALRDAADRLEESALGERLPVRSRDEVGDLTEAFNRMSARLSETTVSRDFVDSVLEAAPDPMIVADPDGRIVYVNGRVQAVLGYSPEELKGRPVEDLVPDAARARHAGLREGYARAPQARPMGAGLDLRARRKDGTEVPVEISLSPASTRRGLRVIATMRDVTEERRARAALRQSVAALQRSNEALEQFAFIASHDLQEPLRKVSSYCQLLERRYADKLDQDGRDFIRYAVDGAARMRALIQDLLTYSRVGRQDGSWERVDLGAVCARALEALQPALEETGARVSVGALPVVRGRAIALAQAMQNLLGNAVKFRSERPLELRVGAERAGEEWVVTVADNGIGIEERHRERIFDVFERLHPQSRYPGTGIGLAIVKRVVEQHGGRVWAEETPGGGSTFRFTLPPLRET